MLEFHSDGFTWALHIYLLLTKYLLSTVSHNIWVTIDIQKQGLNHIVAHFQMVSKHLNNILFSLLNMYTMYLGHSHLPFPPSSSLTHLTPNLMHLLCFFWKFGLFQNLKHFSSTNLSSFESLPLIHSDSVHILCSTLYFLKTISTQFSISLHAIISFI